MLARQDEHIEAGREDLGTRLISVVIVAAKAGEAFTVRFDQPARIVDLDVAVDDAAIVLTHKLRWHDGAQSNTAKPAGESRSRIRRPHFAAAGGAGAALTVFARED